MQLFIAKPSTFVKPWSAGLRLALSAFCGIGLVAVAAPARAFQVVAPNLPYGGKSQFEWAKTFWLNVLDAANAGNPQYASSDGSSLFMINDPSSPVFLLSGTSSGETVSRSIRVPNTKALFFPVFNTFAAEPERLAYD